VIATNSQSKEIFVVTFSNHPHVCRNDRRSIMVIIPNHDAISWY